MNELKLEDLLLAIDKKPKLINSQMHFVVYGAGSFGKMIGELIEKAGFRIQFFLDRVANRDFPWDVRALQNIERADENVIVVLGIHNGFFDLRQITMDLQSHGFVNIISSVELVHSLDRMMNVGYSDLKRPRESSWLPHFWLDSRQQYLSYQSEIIDGLDFFQDTLSKFIYLSTWCFRLTGDMQYLFDPSPADHQYFDNSVQRLGRQGKVPLRFIDCGAFTGDTYFLARQNNYEIAAYAGFEPDLNNFRRLCTEVAKAPIHDAVLFPCAAYSNVSSLSFAANNGASSNINSLGDIAVPGVPIDYCLRNFRPNFIKMDVEGGELDVIEGAIETIKDSRPDLAIAVYHKPQDIFKLAKHLSRMSVGYNFFLRSYYHQGMDTILYAFSQNR